MTNFSYPLTVKRPEMEASGVGSVAGRVPVYVATTVSIGGTGVGPGATTIPLFVAPAGSRGYDCIVDVLTGADSGVSNVNLRVGTATSTGILFAATTVNTAGRRAQTWTGAQVSANAIAYTADTTIQAIVSIDTSAITVFNAIVYTVLL